mmetsp:Transcript_28929/g.69732  ORF Transcript_28929/g.69732 Transcript_28929/m.69732 type:complete len:96 (+) Transcript_28929:341-628(+)
MHRQSSSRRCTLLQGLSRWRSPVLSDAARKEPNMIRYDPSTMRDMVELPSLEDLRGGLEEEASAAESRVIPAACREAEDQQVCMMAKVCFRSLYK